MRHMGRQRELLQLGDAAAVGGDAGRVEMKVMADTSRKTMLAAGRVVVVLMGLALALGSCATTTWPVYERVVVKQGRYLDPRSLEIAPGAKVQFSNDTIGGEVEIEFARSAASPPSIEGSPASPVVRFDKPGRYPYVITGRSPTIGGRSPLIVKDRGEIVVRSPVTGPGPAEGASTRPDIVPVRDSREAAAAHRYSDQQGLVLKMESGNATPPEVKAGEPVFLEAHYTVLAPPPASQIRVKEVWTVSLNGDELGKLEKDAGLGPGTWASQQRLVLPEDAVAGSYVVTTRIEVAAVGQALATTQSTIRFVVRPP
jgi:plastocyanin